MRGEIIAEATEQARGTLCSGCAQHGRLLILQRRHVVTIVHNKWCPVWQDFNYRHPEFWRPEYA